MNIPIARPFIGDDERVAIQAPLSEGWLVQGPYVKRFESQFAQFVGAPFAAATTSCTTALHLAMVALGVRPGDEVIVPAFTWVATPNVVEYMCAKPVFCDIDLKTFNLDVSCLESLITPRTVGILPVHLFGLCVDMDPLLRLANKHKLWVVEDAACAFGAWYRGTHAGLFGEMGCFSFHPRKSITTGEGGMVITRHEKFDRLIRSLRDHGANKSDLTRHQAKDGYLLPEYNMLGYNYRMTDIQGALGCAQMGRAAWILERKQVLAKRYHEQLTSCHWLQLPVVPEGCIHGYQAYVCLFGPYNNTLQDIAVLSQKRNQLMASLEELGISTRQGTHAPPLLEYYVNKYRYGPEQFPRAARADRLSLALPLYPQMTESDQDAVCRSLQTVYESLLE